jgi:ketosteroid isomerase-like protein
MISLSLTRFLSILSLIISSFLFYSCDTAGTDSSQTKFKKEIAEAEKDFARMAEEKSISEAFWYYADSNAVIKRENDTLVRGRQNIRNYYSRQFYQSAKVTWSPDFIEVSPDGNLGYSYGRYSWQVPDSSGKMIEFKGVFHTVWKRQKDGTWRYVWD